MTSKFLADYRKIKEFRENNPAPVDTLGPLSRIDSTAEPRIQRFQILVAILLATQTRDQVTAKVMKNLLKYGLTPENINAIPLEKLEEIIRSVNYHKTKAKNLKSIAREIIEKYNGDIPKNQKDLQSLKGIGEKISTLIMLLAWNKPVGIAVDTHIHQIANKFGWVNTEKPNETKRELEKIVPKKYWSEINKVLVGYGQLEP